MATTLNQLIYRLLRAGTAASIALLLIAALMANPVFAAPTVQPSSFIPDWDGHDDSVEVSWNVPVRALVSVRVLDAKGVVRRQILSKIYEPGNYTAYWDGRDNRGRVLPAGDWRVRITQKASVQPTNDEPLAANLGAPITGSQIQETKVKIQQSPLAVRQMRLNRGAIGKSKKLNSTTASFNLSHRASIAAIILDEKGQVKRSLRVGALKKGAHNLRWNGRDQNKKLVPDGDYSLLVAATTSGRPTATIKTPLRVDRTVPTLQISTKKRAISGRDVVVLPLNFRISEDANLTVTHGKRSYSEAVKAGQNELRIRGEKLGITPNAKFRNLQLKLSAQDATGNVRVRRITMTVPSRSARVIEVPAPTPPAVPSTTIPGPPVVPGRLRWPVSGPVTSEFGPRWGRIHQGLDIGVPEGTPVVAARAGTVISVGTLDGYGIQVTLQHANGLSTRYAHFVSAASGLVAGDRVAQGQIIGLSGCTGNCTGPHVHFETRINDVPHDPRAYLA